LGDLKRDFIWMLSSRTFAIAAGFLAAALINRALGPSMRGVYAEMQTWIGLFAVIFGISMDTAIYHFANKSLYGINDQSRFITTLLLSLMYGLLACAALTIFVYVWPEKVSSETLHYLLLLVVLLIATMVVGNLLIFLQAIGDIRYSAVIGVVQGATNVVIVGYAYWSGLLNIKMVLMSVLIIQGVALIMLLLKFGKYNLLSGKFSKNIAKGIIIVGLKQHIATIATFIYMRINQLIVFRYCGEANAGIFAVSLTAAFYLMFIPMTFQMVLYPRVIHAMDEYEITLRSLRLGFYLWGGIVILIILFAKPILLLYAGRNFLDSINNFRILMVAAWFLPLSSMIAPYYVKAGAFGLASLSALLLGIVSISLNIYLVPRYAALGASLSTALTCLIGFCVTLIFFRYLTRKNPLIIFHPDFRAEIALFRTHFLRKIR
jgi:O-antigen/teichoic acid export membrane protein